jgi:hypothetical protein
MAEKISFVDGFLITNYYINRTASSNKAIMNRSDNGHHFFDKTRFWKHSRKPHPSQGMEQKFSKSLQMLEVGFR